MTLMLMKTTMQYGNKTRVTVHSRPTSVVRLTTLGRREVDEGERGGVVVGCVPNVVVVELAAVAVSFYLI